MTATIAVIAVATLALVLVVGFAILWSQYRVPGMKKVVTAMTAEPEVKRAWSKGRKRWSSADAEVMCSHLRGMQHDSSPERRERLCRHIWLQVAKRTGTGRDWAMFAESAEVVATAADEAGHWLMAEYGWKQALKTRQPQATTDQWNERRLAAKDKAAKLEHRDAVNPTV